MDMTKKRKLVKSLTYGFFFVLLFSVLFLLDNLFPSYHMAITVLKKGTVYALIAVSMNLLNGFTGLFSLGQAGFMLLGAYTFGVLTMTNEARESVYETVGGSLLSFTLPWWLGLICAGALAALCAFLIGLPVLKLKSDYLAIATLGFAEIVKTLITWKKLDRITLGSNQLNQFPLFSSSSLLEGTMFENMSLTPYVLIVAVCILLVVLLIRSTYGRAFKAIRDDEVAAEAMGINLAHHKRLAFVTSSFFAGVGGALLAMYSTTISANTFSSAMTYEILLIVVIGGIGSITGSVLATYLYIICSEWLLRGLDDGLFDIFGLEFTIELPSVFRSGLRMVVFSVVIMVIVLVFRKGIMGDKELNLDFIVNLFCKEKKKDGKGKEDAAK